jgi:hypothetical protein
MNKQEGNEIKQDIGILKIHANDQKAWLIGLSLIVFIIFVITILAVNGLEKKMWAVTQHVGNMPIMPTDYHEECYQSEIVEHDMRDTETCNITTFRKVMVDRSIELTFYGDCPTNVTLNLHYNYPDKTATATYSVTPYIYYWNETVCTKTILVKDSGLVPTITFNFS